MNKEDLEKIIKSNVDRPMHFGGAFKDDSFNKVMDAIEQYATSQTEALKKEIEALKKKTEWISVEEDMPETKSNGSYKLSLPVLIYSDGVIVKARYESNNDGEPEFSQWYCPLIDDTIDYVTHWMPLPTPPKTK